TAALPRSDRASPRARPPPSRTPARAGRSSERTSRSRARDTPTRTHGNEATRASRARSLGGGADGRGVFREHAARVARRRRTPAVTTRCELRVVELDVDTPRFDVEDDRVAVAYERDRSAAERFGRDVPDHQAVGRAGEPSVGHERDVVAEAL